MFAVCPFARPLPTLQPYPHCRHANLRSAEIEQLDIVYGTLSGDSIDGDTHLLGPQLCEKSTIGKINAARGCGADGQRFRPIWICCVCLRTANNGKEQRTKHLS